MKKNVKLLAIFALVVLLLAGCGSEKKEESKKEEKNKTEEVVKYSGIDINKCLNCDTLVVDKEADVSLSSYEFMGVDLIPKDNKLIASVDWYSLGLDLGVTIKGKKPGDSNEYEIKNINAKEVKMVFAKGNGQMVSSRKYAFLMNDGTVKYLDMYEDLIRKADLGESIELAAKDVEDVKDVVTMCSVHVHGKDPSAANGSTTIAFVKADGSFYIL